MPQQGIAHGNICRSCCTLSKDSEGEAQTSYFQTVTEPGEEQGTADSLPEAHGLIFKAGPLPMGPALAVPLS